MLPRTRLLAGCLVVALAASARAEEEPGAGREAAPPTEVWRGYVWKDGEGRLRLGYGVVSMGVIAFPAHVVAGPVAERLAPYAAGKSEYVFWNYSLEKPDATALEGLPTALLRLEGPVREEGGAAPGVFGSRQGTRTMQARATSIEFVRPEWLRAWAVCFRERASPWRIRDDADPSPAGQRAFAEKALAALRAMRAVPPPAPADLEKARALDPACRVSETFRRAEEWKLQAWLVEADRKGGWGLAGIGALPPAPPSSTQIQAWYLESASRAAFLERVRKEFAGDLEQLRLIHYVEQEGSTRWTETDLLEVSERWTDEQHLRHRETTRKMGLGR